MSKTSFLSWLAPACGGAGAAMIVQSLITARESTAGKAILIVIGVLLLVAGAALTLRLHRRGGAARGPSGRRW